MINIFIEKNFQHQIQSYQQVNVPLDDKETKDQKLRRVRLLFDELLHRKINNILLL